MKLGITLVITLSLGVVRGTGLQLQRARETDLDHTQWVSGVLKEIESIKVGMTRRDVLKVFSTEGGLSCRRSRTYVYRDCPYIKVDVEFQPTQQVDEKLREFPDDRIMRISKPYLARPVID